jgi:hypothetical protein
MKKLLILIAFAIFMLGSLTSQAQTACGNNLLADSSGNIIGLCSQFTTQGFGVLIYPPRELYTADTQDGTATNGWGFVHIDKSNQVSLYLPNNPFAPFGAFPTLGLTGNAALTQTGDALPVYPSQAPATLTFTYTLDLGTVMEGPFSVAWTGTFTATYVFTGSYDSVVSGRAGHSIHIPYFQLQEGAGEVDGVISVPQSQ